MAKERQNIKTRLPTLRKPPALPKGPRLYAPVPLSKQPISQGYGPPPTGFVTATTSATEWVVYWALAKITGLPQDPRQGPFDGGWPQWAYQQPLQGGRSGPGGSVLDFVVYGIATHKGDVGLRIQTEYRHIYADNAKQISDINQRDSLEAGGVTIIDIYDTSLLADTTGESAIVTLKNALGLIEALNPIQAGIALRATRLTQLS